jgi:hypothetical protein
MVKRGEWRIEPEARNFAFYDALQERFNSLWQTLREEFKKHRKYLN